MRRTIAQSALVFTSALLIMALVGCGGSSKKTTGTMQPVDPPDPVDPAPTPVALTLPADHLLEAGETTIQPGDDEPLVAYSKGKSTVLSCPSDGEACVVTVAADGSATSTGGTPEVTPLTNQMIWQANNGPGEMSSDGAHALGVLGKIRLSANGEFQAASSDLAADPTRVGPASGTPANAGEGVLTQTTLGTDAHVVPSVERTASGAKFELTLGLTDLGPFVLPDDADSLPKDPTKLTGSTMAPALGTGWTGVALSKNLPGQRLHGVLYSDITANRGSAPEAVLAAELDLSGASDLTEITPSDAETALMFGIEAPSLGTNVMIAATERDWASSLANRETYPVTITYNDAEGNSQSRDGDMRCVSTVCQANGGVLEGTWEITADAVTGTPDSRYLTFGVWASLPEDSGGEYEFGAFADAVGYALTEANLNAISNEGLNTDLGRTSSEDIKYAGSATGLYTKGSYASNGRAIGATVGYFTAAVNLTADFDTTSAFEDVMGTVTDFKENKDGPPLGDWRVSLRATAPASTGIFTGVTAGVANGRALEGNWGMQFFSSDKDDGMQRFGGYAAGTFTALDAATSGARETIDIVGAFGATAQ